MSISKTNTFGFNQDATTSRRKPLFDPALESEFDTPTGRAYIDSVRNNGRAEGFLACAVAFLVIALIMHSLS